MHCNLPRDGRFRTIVVWILVDTVGAYVHSDMKQFESVQQQIEEFAEHNSYVENWDLKSNHCPNDNTFLFFRDDKNMDWEEDFVAVNNTGATALDTNQVDIFYVINIIQYYLIFELQINKNVPCINIISLSFLLKKIY
jgi:hypothetical protein